MAQGDEVLPRGQSSKECLMLVVLSFKNVTCLGLVPAAKRLAGVPCFGVPCFGETEQGCLAEQVSILFTLLSAAKGGSVKGLVGRGSWLNKQEDL